MEAAFIIETPRKETPRKRTAGGTSVIPRSGDTPRSFHLRSWSMPLFYLRRLTGSKRTDSANRHLARYLAFVAGAANAGGFLAVQQYTSHMSGILAGMADNFAIGSLVLVFHGLAAVLSFLLGAFLNTLFVRWARA